VEPLTVVEVDQLLLDAMQVVVAAQWVHIIN
jgi:hypothetical protein